MAKIYAILRRELAGYFVTPVAYVFIVIFLMLAGFLAFQFGQLYESGQADLTAFFSFHPYLYLFLVPALSMRLWAEERKSGSIELLMTLPLTTTQAVVGKFLAAWLFTGVALILTFPIWITVNYLGNPDNGVILASYVGSFLMAGAYLAVGSCVSAVTRNQVIAFVLTVSVCFLLLFAGFPMVLGVLRGLLPLGMIDAIASVSFLTHFTSITKGVIDVRDLVYYAVMIGGFLVANVIVLDLKKAD